jgi:prepilin-type processing-associated H-X9-DG protein
MIPKLAKNSPVARAERRRLTRIDKLGICAIFLLNSLLISLSAEPARSDYPTVLTTVRAVRHLVESGQTIACAVRLEGVVLWASPAREQFILQDDSGGMTSSQYITIDEDSSSINDGMFQVEGQVLNANPINLHDWPATYHGRAAGISFADGHAEMHRWLSLGQAPALYSNGPMGFPNSKAADIIYLVQIATAPN